MFPEHFARDVGEERQKGGNNDGGEKKRGSRGAVRMLNGG